MKPKIAIIGEYYDNFEPHLSLNKALDYLNDEYDFGYEWIETERVEREGDRVLKNFAGLWSAPGSPFKSLDGAFHAITFARLNDIPHLPEISASGVDQDDEIRIIELPGHKFFLITLFVPQTRSMPGSPPPLVDGFVKSVCSK